ncbi:MAG: hypothetical protein LQ344_002971 [Seirophora lacunosa]|nr:MAG: hypothetical protein LQ344_002971 [Seirophora lacunosa]
MSRSSFFDQFPNFRQRHNAPILDEFRRLAQQQGWKRRTWQFNVNRRECLQAEYEYQFGSIEAGNKLAAWQGLCAELGLSANIPSIVKCKKALRRVHVNILDLIDDRRAGRQIETFDSAQALADYTNEHKRYFPLEDAKADSLIKILLKQIR